MASPTVMMMGGKSIFTQPCFGGYKEAKVSRIDPAFWGGYKAIRYDGHTEMAQI